MVLAVEFEESDPGVLRKDCGERDQSSCMMWAGIAGPGDGV